MNGLTERCGLRVDGRLSPVGRRVSWRPRFKPPDRGRAVRVRRCAPARTAAVDQGPRRSRRSHERSAALRSPLAEVGVDDALLDPTADPLKESRCNTIKRCDQAGLEDGVSFSRRHPFQLVCSPDLVDHLVRVPLGLVRPQPLRSGGIGSCSFTSCACSATEPRSREPTRASRTTGPGGSCRSVMTSRLRSRSCGSGRRGDGRSHADRRRRSASPPSASPLAHVVAESEVTDRLGLGRFSPARGTSTPGGRRMARCTLGGCGGRTST